MTFSGPPKNKVLLCMGSRLINILLRSQPVFLQLRHTGNSLDKTFLPATAETQQIHKLLAC